MSSHVLQRKVACACNKKGRRVSPARALSREPQPFGPIQSKLTVGPARDRFEAEADRIALQVTRMQDAAVPGRLVSPAISRLPESSVRRQPMEEDEELQAKREPAVVQRQPIEEEEELLQPKAEPDSSRAVSVAQRLCAGCEEELQAKAGDGNPGSARTPLVGPALENKVAALKGGGQPLAESDRTFFEPRFGADFGGVRVHEGHVAAETARAMGARAFTVGQDIVFGAGRYAPAKSEGRQLLAHELTHVVQQMPDTRSRRFDGFRSAGVNPGYRNVAAKRSLDRAGELGEYPAKAQGAGVPRKAGCCTQADSAGQDDGDIAGVICCNKVKHACVWISGGAKGATNAKAVKIVDACGEAHERDHFDDIDCPNGAGPFRPNFKAGKDAAAEEKKAYKAEAKCLRKSLRQCGKDRTCRRQVRAELKYVRKLA